MSNQRKVLGPDILNQREAILNSNNIWYFITSINRQLMTNPIKEDKSIEATINYNLTDVIANEIVDLYLEAGWKDVLYRYEFVGMGYTNTTVFTFIP